MLGPILQQLERENIFTPKSMRDIKNCTDICRITVSLPGARFTIYHEVPLWVKCFLFSDPKQNAQLQTFITNWSTKKFFVSIGKAQKQYDLLRYARIYHHEVWSKLELNHSHQAQITQLSEDLYSCLSENRSHLHPPRWPNDNFGDEQQQVQSVITQFYEPHLFASALEK